MPAPPASVNGFKSPAPVLPAMGLHSFHNDSPPFAAAPISDHASPEHFVLDNTRSNSGGIVTSNNSEHVDLSQSSSSSSNSIPMPIPQRGFHTSLLAHSPEGQPPLSDAQTTPRSRIPSSEDEHLSSSRSRRLVSGYLFGNPPSPVGGSRPTKGPTMTTHSGEDDSGPSTPLHTDSPPLPDPHTAADHHHYFGAPTASTIRETPETQFEALSMEDGPSAQPVTRRKSTRRDSKTMDKETGYDVFSGMQDGEADLDESAPQAEGSTEAYMQGLGGEAGEYRFPQHRLRTRMKDESKIPLVIVACGSFSPPTYLHLRMFEMAKDEIIESQTYEIMAGYYSPVSSQYKKSGLAPAIHRVRMCELAVEHTSTWLMVDPWEAGQPEYQRTAVVLDHFDEMLNVKGGGIMTREGKRRKYKIMLLAGGDLIESFGEPGVWSEPDLHIILGRFGCLIVERAGSDVWAFLLSHDILYHHRRNVIVIKQLIYNDISSTKVRLFVRRGMSIKYLLPNSVIQYIYDNRLYRESEPKAVTN